jgi:glycosyltransferase involved in cell wall biosynthesis
MMRNHIKKFTSIPVEVVRPTIMDQSVPSLLSVSPDLNSKHCVFVGVSRGHKGIDLLVEAWRGVRQKIPEATLTLVGDHAEHYADVDGIDVFGYAEDLSTIFCSTTLQIHPARFDASPVSTLMGMLAGVPQVVTKQTGTKSEVNRINPDLVVDPKIKSLEKAVVEYLKTDINVRKKYSEVARDIAREFTQSSRSGEFKLNFEELVSRMD